MLSLRVAALELLVDFSRLDDLKVVTETPDSVWIGALTTHAAIEDGKVPDIFNGLMRRVAGQISYRAVRNHGTIGGSVALADPAADWPLLPDRARCQRARGRAQRRARGERRRFRQGPYETTLDRRRHHHGLRHPGAGRRRCAGASPRSRARAAPSPSRSPSPPCARPRRAGPASCSAPPARARAAADDREYRNSPHGTGRRAARRDRRGSRRRFPEARRLPEADAHGDGRCARCGTCGRQ